MWSPVAVTSEPASLENMTSSLRNSLWVMQEQQWWLFVIEDKNSHDPMLPWHSTLSCFVMAPTKCCLVENQLKNKLFILKTLTVFRVWDKVISGSCKILVFVALEILLSYKIVLMGMSRPEGVVKFLCSVSSMTGHSYCPQKSEIHCFYPHSWCCSPSRYRRKTQMPLWPKPLTCGTNTVALQYMLCSYMELQRHLGPSCYPRMQHDWQDCVVGCQWGFVSAWLNSSQTKFNEPVGVWRQLRRARKDLNLQKNATAWIKLLSANVQKKNNKA